MRAAIFNRFGGTDVLKIADIAKPQVKPDEILVKVWAAAVNPKDTFVRKGRFKLFTGKQFPMQTGYDFAGKVAAIGKQVTVYEQGQAVFGMLDGWQGRTCAEYIAVKTRMLAPMPPTLSFAEAAALPLTASTSLQALRDEAGIHSGWQVAVNGASGGVGAMAVQIAKLYGARVTAISGKANHDFLRDLGAETCLDYHDTDVTAGNQQYHIFYDVFGNQPFKRVKPILKRGGTWVSTVVKPHVFISQWATRLFGRHKARLVVVKARHADLVLIRDWVGTGQLRPVIQDVYPLDKIREAHAQQETKHTRGKIVISID
jgi:NADPH:quinone reductase-like Zn-dependent oxidoreductase